MTDDKPNSDAEKIDPELRLKLMEIETQAGEDEYPDFRRGNRVLWLTGIPVWLVGVPLVWIFQRSWWAVAFLALLPLGIGLAAALRPKR